MMVVKQISRLAVIAAELSRRGLPIATLEVDEAWQWRQSHVAERVEYGPLSDRPIVHKFYRTLFRWTATDGRRFAMVLDPVIRERGRSHYEEDAQAMAAQIIPKIVESLTDAGTAER